MFGIDLFSKLKHLILILSLRLVKFSCKFIFRTPVPPISSRFDYSRTWCIINNHNVSNKWLITKNADQNVLEKTDGEFESKRKQQEYYCITFPHTSLFLWRLIVFELIKKYNVFVRFNSIHFVLPRKTRTTWSWSRRVKVHKQTTINELSVIE